MAALFARLSGGRGETACGMFVVLALLSRYRDWPVFATAFAVLAADHLTRGATPHGWAGPSGLPAGVRWRLAEHVGWAGAECVFLAAAARHASPNLRRTAEWAADADRVNCILRAVQEASPDAVLVSDERRQVVTHNRRFAEVFAFAPDLSGVTNDEELARAAVSQFADPDLELARINELYAQPQAVATDTMPMADGRVLERYTRPALAADGRPLGRVWFFRDVTDRGGRPRPRRRSTASWPWSPAGRTTPSSSPTRGATSSG